MARPTLTIVMPAYNEEGCIVMVLRKWLGVFVQLQIPASAVHLVVVNDGSKDNTGKLANELAKECPNLHVIQQANAGHGAALIRAYREAIALGSEWIFHVDSDDQFSPQDLALLWQVRTQSKFILGQRRVRHDALHRLVITRIVITLNFLLFGCYIPDANIPYRLIKAEYLQLLLSALPGQAFAPNIFLAVLAALEGQKLFNVPVQHVARQTGSVSIVRWKLIKICFRCAHELWEFRKNLRGRIASLKTSSYDDQAA